MSYTIKYFVNVYFFNIIKDNDNLNHKIWSNYNQFYNVRKNIKL